MKRTTVFVDEEDLAILKAAAERRDIAEAKLLREGVHLVAMANRAWDEPFFSRTYTPERPTSTDRAREELWKDKAEAYEHTKDLNT